ncbi:MAG: DUF192 domain-containing protein [Luteibaculum sp.]
MKNPLKPLFAACFVAFALFSCDSTESGSIKRPEAEKPQNQFKKDGSLAILDLSGDTVVSLEAEFADTDYEIQRGMMFRKEMGDLQGMLFFMPDEKIQSFWMKNCYLSLDMIFADSKGVIGSAQTYTEPYSLSSLPSEKPAKYVLEVKAGFWDKHNIQPGYKIVYSKN